MDNTRISYVDASWSPVRGCSPAGVGCAHCFAAALASRFNSGPFAGLASGGRWTGTPRFVPEQLEVPRQWKRPRRILTPTMGDVFHPAITTDQIVSIFEVMAACERHTFLSLTKRPERMEPVLYGAAGNWYFGGGDYLPSVWLGTSVSTQADVDRAVLALLSTGIGWHYWLSVEPLLERVDIEWALSKRGSCNGPTDEADPDCERCRHGDNTISFVVVGGESGPHARPCEVAWIRDVVRQCRAAGVPVWVKQLGAVPIISDPPRVPPSSSWPEAEWPDGTRFGSGLGCPSELTGRRVFLSGAAHDMDEWPEDLRVREMPEGWR